jgi:hypothetical protein
MGLGAWAKKKIEEKLEERRFDKAELERNKEENRKHRSEIEAILDKFDMSDLQNFVEKFLGGVFTKEEKLADGSTLRKKPDRYKIVNQLLERFDNGFVKAGHIKDFALKHKIVLPSFFKTTTESKAGGDENEFNSILDLIEEKFKPEKIKDEKELQGQLAVFLNAVTNTKVEREVKTKSGDKIDILIDDNYVLELKVPSGKDSLRSLSAQIEEYMEEFPLLAVVIADKSDLVSDQDDHEFYDPNLEKGLTQRIKEYVDRYKVKYGVRTLVFNVKKRK